MGLKKRTNVPFGVRLAMVLILSAGMSSSHVLTSGIGFSSTTWEPTLSSLVDVSMDSLNQRFTMSLPMPLGKLSCVFWPGPKLLMMMMVD
jgi:hypothetical protein